MNVFFAMLTFSQHLIADAVAIIGTMVSHPYLLECSRGLTVLHAGPRVRVCKPIHSHERNIHESFHKTAR